MKILQITEFRVVRGYGGGEKVFVNMSNQFAKKHKVIGISYDAIDGKTYYPLNEKINI